MAGDIVIGSVQPAEEIVLMAAAEPEGGAGFDALFREHYPRLVAMLARLTGDRAQAEEIASDVFCKVSKRATADLPWIYRVATNAGLDALRSNARRRRREDAAGAEALRGAASGGALEELLRSERQSPRPGRTWRAEAARRTVAALAGGGTGLPETGGDARYTSGIGGHHAGARRIRIRAQVPCALRR